MLTTSTDEQQPKMLDPFVVFFWGEGASILLTIARDLQIGSRAIETFQDGLFGRVVEVGLYK